MSYSVYSIPSCYIVPFPPFSRETYSLRWEHFTSFLFLCLTWITLVTFHFNFCCGQGRRIIVEWQYKLETMKYFEKEHGSTLKITLFYCNAMLKIASLGAVCCHSSIFVFAMLRWCHQDMTLDVFLSWFITFSTAMPLHTWIRLHVIGSGV
jgi:hypothetical protein